MAMAGASEVSQEDVTWHKEECLYRRFMEVDRESVLETDESIRKDLTVKYRKDVLAARPSDAMSRRIKVKRSRKAKKTLTSDEKVFVKGKVETALEPSGPIRWYLESQRTEFQQAKRSFLQQCDCVKETANAVDKALTKGKGRTEEAKVAPVSGEPVVDEESAANDDDIPSMAVEVERVASATVDLTI